MAKSLITINMEFNKAKKQAEKLEEIAREIEQTADDKMGNALAGINSAWKSDTAASYLQKGTKVQEDLKNRAKELRKVATTIRQIAKNTYDAEMNAYRIALERLYKG